MIRAGRIPQKLASGSQLDSFSFLIEKIANLVYLHVDLINEYPRESLLVVRGVPAKLRDPDQSCAENIHRQKAWLESYIKECIISGIRDNEFISVPVGETAYLLMSCLNGLMQQMVLSPLKVKERSADNHRIAEQAMWFVKRGLNKEH